MKRLPWWGNLLGEAFLALLVWGSVKGLAWFNGETVPVWGGFVAVLIGFILWTRPSYDRLKDFYE